MVTDKHNAFTLIEVVLSMAIILILAGALLTGGKYLKTRAERQLTQSAIEIIGTAMTQYYDQTKRFPPMVSCLDCIGTNPDGTPLSLKAVLSANDVKVVGTPSPGSTFWRSASAYYFLSRIPQPKSMIDSLTGRMISSKDSNGSVVKVEIQMLSGGSTDTYDWVRFVDAWGMTMQYSYSVGDVFPVITSAGPDKQFDTDDDLTSQ